MEIKQDNKNELFRRQEIVAEIESDKAVSFDEARSQVIEHSGKESDLIDVYDVKGSFGRNKFIIRANIYDSKEDLEKIKKLEMTSKQRKEGLKIKSGEENDGGSEKIENPTLESRSQSEASEESESSKDVENTKTDENNENEEKSVDSSPVENKPEMIEDEVMDKPEEAPVEERPEEEHKAVKEESQIKEESKEN